MLFLGKANGNRVNEEEENGQFHSYKTIQFIFTGGKLQLEKLFFNQMHIVEFNTG